jgi:hypothetical protein
MDHLRSIHELGLVGHIEDIAVAKDQQGKKLGLRIIQALDFVAEKVGCYKVCAILHDISLLIRHGILTMRIRLFLTAPKRMKDSTSSAGTGEQAWKWHIITRLRKLVTSKHKHIKGKKASTN